jgi:hypothetical protein
MVGYAVLVISWHAYLVGFPALSHRTRLGKTSVGANACIQISLWSTVAPLKGDSKAYRMGQTCGKNYSQGGFAAHIYDTWTGENGRLAKVRNLHASGHAVRET